MTWTIINKSDIRSLIFALKIVETEKTQLVLVPVFTYSKSVFDAIKLLIFFFQ